MEMWSNYAEEILPGRRKKGVINMIIRFHREVCFPFSYSMRELKKYKATT